MPLDNGEGDLDVHNKIIPAGRWEGGTRGHAIGQWEGGLTFTTKLLLPGDGGDLRPHWKLSPSGDERGVFNVKNNVISATGLWGGGPNIHNKT